jgi:hypothetical protein
VSGGLRSLGSFAQSELGRTGVVGVEQWAEIRRLHFVARLSQREIRRRTGLHRDTIRRALASEAPPRYSRALKGSKLDPFRWPMRPHAQAALKPLRPTMIEDIKSMAFGLDLEDAHLLLGDMQHSLP